MITCQMAHSIWEFDEDDWDTVAGSELAMTHRWQRVMETSWSHYQPRYLLLQDSQGPLAAVVANAARSFGYTGWRERLLQRFTLVMSAPFSAMHCGVVVRPGTALAAVLPQLERALDELCWQEKRPVLAVSNVATSDLPAWRARRFLASARDAASVINLPSDYDQYLKILSRKNRSGLGRMRRRAADLGVSFDHGPLAGEGEQLYPLICEVFARHGTPASEMPFTATFFTILEREMAGEVMVFKGFVSDELAGVSLCLVDGQILWSPVIGLHYELSRPSYLYFLLTDEMIRWSIEHGVQCIYGGLTSEREKRKHGFHLYERWFCYRASPRPLNSALTLALSLVQRLTGRLPQGSQATMAEVGEGQVNQSE